MRLRFLRRKLPFRYQAIHLVQHQDWLYVLQPRLSQDSLGLKDRHRKLIYSSCHMHRNEKAIPVKLSVSFMSQIINQYALTTSHKLGAWCL